MGACGQGRRGARFIWAKAAGGPGEAAGLRVGDRILAVDGQSRGIQERLDGAAGSRMRLTVQREGRPESFDVTVTRAPVGGGFRDFWIYDVSEDRDGAMWFGLSYVPEGGEILRYDVRWPHDADAWRLYDADDGLSMGYRQRMVQTQDGAMWTVSDVPHKGMNRFDGTSWANLRLSRLGGYDINPSVVETGDGTLWVGGHWGYLHAYRNGVWTIYKAPQIPIPRTRIIDPLWASDGALWIAGRGQEALRLDCGTARWTTYENLQFQCETPDGVQWFVSRDRGVVSCDGKAWTRYGVADGLMRVPLGLMATREGVLWASGSHDRQAATARFDGKRWSLQVHPRLSWAAILGYEDADGSLWFGASVNWRRELGHVGGVLRFDGESWTQYTPPEAPDYIYGAGQTSDGVLWFVGRDVRRFDGETWSVVTGPEGLATRYSDEVHATQDGDLWVSHRSYGAFHYNGETWIRHDVRDGLADNQVKAILQTNDQSVWVATPGGLSRFDGRTWVTRAVANGLESNIADRGLRQTRDGALWINYYARQGNSPRVWTVRYRPDARPPQTEITLSLDEVSQAGNTTLAWTGADPRRTTPDGELLYAWCLDGGAWSAFSNEKSRTFQSVSSGKHVFEVKARDRDFNEDPTPAAARFTVLPPVWRQAWFVTLVVAFAGVTAFLPSRIVARDASSRRATRPCPRPIRSSLR